MTNTVVSYLLTTWLFHFAFHSSRPHRFRNIPSSQANTPCVQRFDICPARRDGSNTNSVAVLLSSPKSPNPEPPSWFVFPLVHRVWVHKACWQLPSCRTRQMGSYDSFPFAYLCLHLYPISEEIKGGQVEAHHLYVGSLKCLGNQRVVIGYVRDRSHRSRN